MTRTMQISLRAGERIFINGAVVRADRKVSLELMNDVVFLLEAHVLQAEETTTPLRQLYFVLQAILMDPQNARATLVLFEDVLQSTLASFSNETVVSGLKFVRQMVTANRIFDALRAIRGLFPVEAKIFESTAAKPSRAA